MGTPLENEIAARFGTLPNFFRLSSADPAITANLWGFAQFAYLNNPLPSLFKERLFVYLSRFCQVRYCIARHMGFLIGLGHPAGDAACAPHTVESVLPLLRQPLARRDDLVPLLAVCASLDSPLLSFPGPDSPGEQALFACATHVFLQTDNARKAHEALRRTLSAGDVEQLNLLLAFVRTAHYTDLLATHEVLAECILKDPYSENDRLSQQVARELASLRNLRQQHESMTQAYAGLSIDHQYIKHNLQATEENLRELVSVMPAAVYACDKEGAITYFNHRASELWGRTPEQGASFWTFLDSLRIFRMDGTPLLPEESLTRSVLATGTPVVNRELAIERSDGSRIKVVASITALRDAAGGINGAVSVFQDITELRRVQEEREKLLRELERSNRDLSEFSFTVSHDLQAPVRNVRTLAQLLIQRNESLPEDSSRLLGLIEQAADGMDRLIASLLQYAQAGHGQLNRQRVSIDRIIESVRKTLSPLIAETGARIVYSARNDSEVDADPILLEQLLQNLVANAIQYRRIGEAPAIEISVESVKDGWQFAVKDNGQGIPRKYQNRVFEPLKRLHGQENPGTGLGLALCRTIAARHGGRIWVDSDGTGQGSTFRFTFSASEGRASVLETTTVA